MDFGHGTTVVPDVPSMVESGMPAEFNTLIRNELEKWFKAAEAAGLKGKL